MTSATKLWELFVQDGAALGERLQQMANEEFPPDQLEGLVLEVNAIAVPAMMLGCDSLARLTLDCERALVNLARGRAEHELLGLPLQRAATEIILAFDTLAGHGEGDTRLDDQALHDVSRQITRGLAGEAPSSPPADGQPDTRRSMAAAAARRGSAGDGPPSSAHEEASPLSSPLSRDQGASLWEIFVADGADQAARLKSIMASVLDSVTVERPALDNLASDLSGLGTQALMMGCESIGRLALDCERAVGALVAGRGHPGALVEQLQRAGVELAAAFATLSETSDTAMQLDETDLAAVRHDLGRAMAGKSVPPPPPAEAPPAPSPPPAAPPPTELAPRAPSPPPPEPVLRAPSSSPPPTPLSPDPPADAALERQPSGPQSATPQEVAPSPAAAHPSPASPTTTESAPPPDVEWTWEPQVDDELIEMFFVEADERLASLDDRLLELERHPDDAELVADIFRDLHTLKGNAALVGLKPFKELAHAAEDLLAQVREGELRADGAIVDTLVDSVEELRTMAAAASRREPLDRRSERLLIQRLRSSAETPAVQDNRPSRPPKPTPAQPTPAQPTPAQPTPAQPAPAPPPPAPPPPPTVPEPAAAAPIAPALRKGARSAQPVQQPDKPAARSERVTARGGAREQGRKMLRVDFAKLDRLMNLVGELVLDKANFGTNLQQLSAIAAGMASGRKRIAGVGRDSGRAISRAEVRALAEELAKLEQNFETLEQEFSRTSQRLDNVTGDLRDQVMQLRMVPIGTVFRRFGVRVRELAIRHEKDVRLELVGEHTELDRMLVDHIDAPLLHLVTNAVYHGIETSAERVAAGKDPQGLLRLRAFQQGNQIVIEVHDDGGGIDPSVIRTIASERGIRSAEELAAMDDKEVLVLIMDPRLSGVLQVDEDAGRGVGMTVVWKTIITGLKGSIDIDSTVGVGTTFTLKLPLTLAIIQVVLLRAGAETVAMPLDLVTRTLTCSPEDIRHVCDREVLQLGDRQVPLVRLAQAIGAASVERPGPHHQDSTPASLQRHVILVDLWGQTYGLLCDRLVGKQEVVIKSLGDLLEEVPGVAGATLLRDRCVVILDIPVIIDRASHASYDALSPAVADQGGGRAQSSVPRILVVDDSDMTRESIKRLLEDEGYQVSSAVDGEDALRLAQEGHFDLISTDAMMPNMDGYELTRALRAEPRHRDTPIMMVTSRDQTADRVLGFDAGVDAYLTKPFNRSELLEIVAVHLRRASPTTEAEAQ